MEQRTLESDASEDQAKPQQGPQDLPQKQTTDAENSQAQTKNQTTPQSLPPQSSPVQTYQILVRAMPDLSEINENTPISSTNVIPTTIPRYRHAQVLWCEHILPLCGCATGCCYEMEKDEVISMRPDGIAVRQVLDSERQQDYREDFKKRVKEALEDTGKSEGDKRFWKAVKSFHMALEEWEKRPQKKEDNIEFAHMGSWM